MFRLTCQEIYNWAMENMGCTLFNVIMLFQVQRKIWAARYLMSSCCFKFSVCKFSVYEIVQCCIQSIIFLKWQTQLEWLEKSVPLLKLSISQWHGCLEIELSDGKERGWKRFNTFQRQSDQGSRQHASESRSYSAAGRTKRLLCSLDGAVWGSTVRNQPGKTSRWKSGAGADSWQPVPQSGAGLAGARQSEISLHFGHPEPPSNWWRMPPPAPNHVTLSQSCPMIRKEVSSQTRQGWCGRNWREGGDAFLDQGPAKAKKQNIPTMFSTQLWIFICV